MIKGANAAASSSAATRAPRISSLAERLLLCMMSVYHVICEVCVCLFGLTTCVFVHCCMFGFVKPMCMACAMFICLLSRAAFSTVVLGSMCSCCERLCALQLSDHREATGSTPSLPTKIIPTRIC